MFCQHKMIGEDYTKEQLLPEQDKSTDNTSLLG